MHWQKAKNVMIAFLIAVNAALLVYIVADGLREKRINSQMAETTAALLASRGIEADKELLVTASAEKSIKGISAQNVITDYQSFAQEVLGGEVIKKNDVTFENERGKISFNGDYFEAQAFDNQLLKTAGISKITAAKEGEEYLKSMGFGMKNAEKTIVFENDKFIFECRKSIDGLDVFGMGIRVEMSESGILSVSGSWYNETNRKFSKTELRSVSGVMIDYMNMNASRKQIKIADISLGYSALDTKTYHESIVLTPVWKITDEAGKTSYIEARENM